MLRIDPGSFGETTTALDPPAGTRIEVANGCPTTIGTSASLQPIPFVNPHTSGLADEFVPDTPTTGLICRYAGVDHTQGGLGPTGIIGGSLTSQTRLVSDAANTLAKTANDVKSPPFTVSGCMPGPDGPGFTIIAFSYANRSDVDIWYRDACPSLSNGIKIAEPLVNGYGADFAAAIGP